MTTLQTLRREDTLDLAGLAAELNRRQETKRDYIVDTRRISIVSDEARSENVFDDNEGVSTAATVNEYAHGQIAERLRIPKKYYDRMRGDAPSLLDTNVLQWLWGEPERRMIRTLDGKCRAFLSDRYRRLDDYDLMEHLLPVFGEIDGLTFHAAALTDTRLYVRAILPSLEREIKLGDIVQAGVEIRNSEVGASALAVQPYLWRLSCLNGMISNVGALRKYHVGRRIEESEDVYGVFADETRAADDKAFFLKARDLVRAALTEATFETIVEAMREAADPSTRVENPVAATERLGASYSLTERETASVLSFLVEGGDLSQWGVANAVTAAAKTAPDFDRLVEMEEIGGALVALPAREWSSYREAATTAA